MKKLLLSLSVLAISTQAVALESMKIGIGQYVAYESYMGAGVEAPT